MLSVLALRRRLWAVTPARPSALAQDAAFWTPAPTQARTKRLGDGPLVVDDAPAFRVWFGSAPGKCLRVKGAELRVGAQQRHGQMRMREGVLPTWTKGQVAVSFTGKVVHRLFILEPSDQHNSFTWGPFGFEGRYKVVDKVNRPVKASARWKAFMGRAE
jgi:hypothetical protein